MAEDLSQMTLSVEPKKVIPINAWKCLRYGHMIEGTREEAEKHYEEKGEVIQPFPIGYVSKDKWGTFFVRTSEVQEITLDHDTRVFGYNIDFDEGEGLANPGLISSRQVRQQSEITDKELEKVRRLYKTKVHVGGENIPPQDLTNKLD